MLLLAPVRAVVLAAILLFVLGAAWSTFVANTSANMQLASPDHLRGRVLGFQSFGFVGLQPIGGLMCGWLADVGGTELAFFVSGGAVAVAAVWAALALRGRPHRLPAPLAAER